jgi:hypothetical protein
MLYQLSIRHRHAPAAQRRHHSTSPYRPLSATRSHDPSETRLSRDISFLPHPTCLLHPRLPCSTRLHKPPIWTLASCRSSSLPLARRTTAKVRRILHLFSTVADPRKTGSKKDASTKILAQENLNPRLSIAPLPGRLRMYVPPANFGAVETNSIYRSGYPTSKNFDFINSLNIRTILYVFSKLCISTSSF